MLPWRCSQNTHTPPLKAAISALLKVDIFFRSPFYQIKCLAARMPASFSQVSLSAPSSIMPAPF